VRHRVWADKKETDSAVEEELENCASIKFGVSPYPTKKPKEGNDGGR